MNRKWKSAKENRHCCRNHYHCSCSHGKGNWEETSLVNKQIVILCEPALAHINLNSLWALELNIPHHSDVQVLEKSWKLLGKRQKVLGVLYQFQQAADAG